MRRLALACLIAGPIAACGGPNPAGDDGGTGSDGNGEQPAFKITSKDVTLNPGQEVTYCYYFHTPNTQQLIVKKWASEMTPGSHHMIMYWGQAGQPADGTLDTSCGGAQVPVWVYATQNPKSELAMPTDDGAGKPLGMVVPPNQPGYFQMHYLNQGDDPLTVHVDLEAYAYEAGVAYTPTAAFITYNGDISIPAGATNYPQTQTCTVPANVQFWTISTHSHKQSVATQIADGASVIFNSTDWEHPGAQSWMSTPFYKFASGQLTYSCNYTNMTSHTITDGSSAQTDEMCMATGYMFPAPASKFCYTNQGPF